VLGLSDVTKESYNPKIFLQIPKCSPTRNATPHLFLWRGVNALDLSEHEGDARPNTLEYLRVDDIEDMCPGVRCADRGPAVGEKSR
jgi:hypothetical protein